MPKTYDQTKTRRLTELREQAKLTQIQAGEYFGLTGSKSRDAVRDWEYGRSQPKVGRRARFVAYLWEKLGLKADPEQMHLLWREVMVGQWGWASLESHELPKGRPHQILAPTPDFVGRTDEVNHLVAHLRTTIAAGKVALCAIHGMGGIGKTELASKVASEVAELFPDGQLLIELKGEDRANLPHEQALSPVQALKRIIRELTYDKDIPDTEQEVGARYRSVLAHRRVLILVDNARDTAHVRPFIPPPGSALLVTSRVLINLNGIETVHPDVLSPDAAETLLVEICPRIGTHAPELARLCGFLPLALRISASLLKVTPMLHPSTFVEQLRVERLSHLVDPEGHPDDHRVSVEASLRLSFNALDLNMQQALVQLSVFPASFDLNAAKAVVQGVDAVQEQLEKLYRRSMVEWQTTTERYALHELVREFCMVRLGAPETVQLRHAQHYAAVATKADQVYREGNNPSGLALFDQERVHIDAGWAWVQTRAGEGDADKLLLTYADATYYIGELRYNNRRERIPQFDAALIAAQRLRHRDMEGKFLSNLGLIYADLGELHWAIEHYEQSLAIMQDLGDRQGEAYALSNLGGAYLNLGEVQQAIDCHQRSLTIMQEIKDRRGAAYGLSNLGWASMRLGQIEQAIVQYRQSLAMMQDLGDRQGEGSVQGHLGSAYCMLGEGRRAIACHQQSSDIAREIGDRRAECYALGNLGWASYLVGEAHQAIDYHRQSLDIARAIGSRHAEGYALRNQGDVYCTLDKAHQSIKLCEQALVIARDLGERGLECLTLNTLGRAYYILGEGNWAIDCHQRVQARVVRPY